MKNKIFLLLILTLIVCTAMAYAYPVQYQVNSASNFNNTVYHCTNSACNSLSDFVSSDYGNTIYFNITNLGAGWQYFAEYSFQSCMIPHTGKISVDEYTLNGPYSKTITFTKSNNCSSEITQFILSSNNINLSQTITINAKVKSALTFRPDVLTVPTSLRNEYSTNVTVILNSNGVEKQRQIVNVVINETADVSFSYTPAEAGNESMQIISIFEDECKCTDWIEKQSPILILNTTNQTTPPTPINHAPVLDAIGNKSIVAGNLLSFAINATDEDNDTLTYSSSALPTGATFNSGTRTFSWNPTNLQNGTYPLIFSVTDGNLSDSETININVTANQTIPPTNDTTPPIITIISPVNQTYQDNNINFSATISEPGYCSLELDNQTYSMLNSSSTSWYIGYLDYLVILNGCHHKAKYTCSDIVGNTAQTGYVYFSINFTGCFNQTDDDDDDNCNENAGTSTKRKLSISLPLLSLKPVNAIAHFRVIIENKGSRDENGLIILQIQDFNFKRTMEFSINKNNQETVLFYIPITKSIGKVKAKITLEYAGKSEDYYYNLNVVDNNGQTSTTSDGNAATGANSGSNVGITGNVISGSATGVAKTSENQTYSITILLILIAICTILVLIARKRG